MKERIRLLLLSKYGPKAEQLSDAQLALLELEPGVTREEVTAEAALPASEKKLTRRVAAPHGRSPLPAHLPRVEELIPVPADQRHCATCGCAKCVICHDLTEVLDLKPVELFVRVIKREKLACPRHPEAGVAMGPAPERIIPGGKLTGATLKQYLDHQPLFRQNAALWRDAQVHVSPRCWATASWPWARCCSPSTPPSAWNCWPAITSKPTKPRWAWQWQYSVPGGPVVFNFQMSRSRAGPAALLQHYRGVVQTDAYSAYDSVIGPDLIHAGCWAHARRKFHEAHQVDPADAAAREVLERISRLYAVEAQARAEKLTAVARQQRRAEQSATEVAELKARLLTIRAEALPGSQLAKACDYAMRPVALGRKNLLHIGDEKPARRSRRS